MLINPCDIAANPSNTGSECSDALKASAMIIMVPKLASWTTADLADFTAYLRTKIHAAAGSRFYPLFGNSAPIKNIVDAPEADVTETFEDGSMNFIRNGMFNRTFLTTEGGLCLAKALMSFSNFKYAFIEVDIAAQVAMMENADGTFSGFPLNMSFPPTPELANLKTSYKNKFMISFSPSSYIKKGKVWASDDDEDILSLMGLLDAKVTKGLAVQSITNVFVGAETICGETDLVTLYTGTGAGKIGQIANFIVTKVSDGTVVTPTAVAIVNNANGDPEVRLTGTYTSGSSYYVAFAAPSVLKTNGITGYEGKAKATVPIP